jgi:plasmid maintenance system antidote protein VapI
MGIVENISPLGAREQISLQTFALLLGVSEGDVIDIFRGQRELTATQILRLAKFFDVKVEDILVPQKLKTFHPPSLDPANLEKALQYVHAGFANTREQYEFPYADEIKIAIAGVENLQPNSSVETVVSAVRAHMDKLNQEDALRHAKK